MATFIKLTLRSDDAEPILRKAAYEAARNGALSDHMTLKTHDAPTGFNESFIHARARWLADFLSAKRIVEAFGVEYEQTSEPETLTVWHDYVGGKRKVRNLPGIGPVATVTGSQPDYRHPRPAYRREVHSHACHAAAERVVRAWRQSLAQAQMAA